MFFLKLNTPLWSMGHTNHHVATTWFQFKILRIQLNFPMLTQTVTRVTLKTILDRICFHFLENSALVCWFRCEYFIFLFTRILNGLISLWLFYLVINCNSQYSKNWYLIQANRLCKYSWDYQLIFANRRIQYNSYYIGISQGKLICIWAVEIWFEFFSLRRETIRRQKGQRKQ